MASMIPDLYKNDKPLQMLGMEEELSGPDAQEVMKKYDTKLINLDQRRVQAMNQGLTQEDFKRCECLGEAIILARKIIRLAIKN